MTILDQIVLEQEKLLSEGVVTFPAHLRPIVELSTGQTYPSAKHAARILGVPSAEIHNSASGRSGLVSGFCFAYESDLAVDIEETPRGEGIIEVRRLKIKRPIYEALLKIARDNDAELDLEKAVNDILSCYINDMKETENEE